MSRVVLFYGQSETPLLLSRVERADDGTVLSGWVENGGWRYVYKNGEVQAKAGQMIVNRWHESKIRVVEVPESIRGDYNKVIGWAVGELANQAAPAQTPAPATAARPKSKMR